MPSRQLRLAFRSLALLPLVTTGCLSALLGGGDHKSPAYVFPNPGSGWEAIDPAEADRAFRYEPDQSVLSVSSQCGDDRYDSLEVLAQDILRQLGQPATDGAPRKTTVDGQPGLIMDAHGTVDGTELSVRLAVIRTPRCIYDVLLAGKRVEPAALAAFDRSLAGFKTAREAH